MNQQNMSKDAIDAWNRAADFLSRGWSIVPIKAGTKAPNIKNWNQFFARVPTKHEVIYWIGAGYRDWGICCGKISNLIVVDIDDDDAREWAVQKGLGNGPSVATGKGYHHYYLADNDAEIKKIVKLLGKNLDIISNGGMVLAPGSVHPSGSIYEWIDADQPLENLPDWVRNACKLHNNPGQKNNVVSTAKSSHYFGGHLVTRGSSTEITEGSRNNHLHKIASSCRGKEGLELNDIILRLRSENERICHPPLPESEILNIAESAMRYAPGIKRYENTDAGNVNRLVDMLDGNMRYVISGGYWITWNGKVWTPEDEIKVLDFAKKANASIAFELQNPNLDSDEKRALFKHYQKSMSYRCIDSVAKLAKTDERVWIDATELDSNPMLFNCPNGTLNLITGKLEPHRREDFITKIGGVNFDESMLNISADEIYDSSWYRFCRGMFLHPEDESLSDGTIDYFQRLLGYLLTGSNNQQKWFLWRGIGANGKSTTMNVLRRIFGDYAIYLDVKTFMKSSRNSEANLARARGARLVMTSEPAPGSQLDETLIKTATGGGEVEARYLYKKPFSYIPTWKIVMESNSRPNISGGDEGNYRRIHELDFQGNFRNWPTNQNEQYYRGYSRSIDADLKSEISLIFGWIVAGALKFRKTGLNPPARIEGASMQYRMEMDPMKSFIDDVCNVGKHEFVQSNKIRRAFNIWAQINIDEREQSARWISDRLTEKGFSRKKINGVRCIVGLSINDSILADLERRLLRL